MQYAKTEKQMLSVMLFQNLNKIGFLLNQFSFSNSIKDKFNY